MINAAMEWDLLSQQIELNGGSNDPVLDPIPNTIRIERDDDFNIKVTVDSNFRSDDQSSQKPAGEIAVGKDVSGLPSKHGEITLHSAIKAGYANFGDGRSRYDLNVHLVSASVFSDVPVTKVVEYFFNGPTSWSHQTERSQNLVARKTPLSAFSNHWSFNIEDDGGLEYSTDTLFLQTKHGEFLLAKVPDALASKKYRPVSLTFPPDDRFLDQDTRKKVVTALSFALGRSLIKIGDSMFDINNNVVRRSSLSPWSVNLDREVQTDSRAPNAIDETIPEVDTIAAAINGVLDSYDELDLGNVLLNFRLAQTLPLGSSLVFYASSMEALAKAWFNSKRTKRTGYIIDRIAFDATIGAPLQTLKLAIPSNDPQWKKIVNKLNSLNSVGTGGRIEQFLVEIGLPIGAVEDKAMHARNFPAHGYIYEKHEYEFLLRTSNAYKTLVQRALLKVTNGAVTYTDYSCNHFPSRPIDAVLGGPKGDGVPCLIQPLVDSK